MLQEAQQKLAADDNMLRERMSRAEAAANEAESKLRRCVDVLGSTHFPSADDWACWLATHIYISFVAVAQG